MKYLKEGGIFTEQRFRFSEGRPCVINLISYFSRITDKIQERTGCVDSVYLDMKKAFDKVPHK